jgi:hypothetical protein
MFVFYILLTVHLEVILVNDQLDALFLNVFISFGPPDDEHLLLETCRGMK